MEDAIVLFPSPAIGHLVSMVELGKLILTHRPSLHIHILMASQAYDAGPTSGYISAVSASVPSFTFHHLATTCLPSDYSISSPHKETLGLELLRLNSPNVRSALLSISESHRVRALIIDFFCSHALHVAKDLAIPCYYFFTSSAGTLIVFFYFPTIHKSTTASLRDLDCSLGIPGSVQFLASDMPPLLMDRHDRGYELFLESAMNIQKADGVIVNSFEELESRSIQIIMDGHCVPDGPTPPLYCLGPLLASHDRSSYGENENVPESLKWLDKQPSGSVVFLCFGSLGVFSKDQLKEIATGLERSGQRFLWVVRHPPPEPSQSPPVTDLGSLLPDGFLDRTKERGLVVESWAPQVEVLSHDAVGGFVTHCGWNSVLEAVRAGVPMVAWPLYAEQRMNREMMVQEMKIAVPMNEAEDRSVSAAEVEKRVRELMDSEMGSSLKKRLKELKEAVESAMSPCGSSRIALDKLVDSWNLN